MNDRYLRRAVRGLGSVALALAATAAPVFAQSERPLSVLVRGPVDASAIRSGVASELGATVTAAEGSCDAPCLVVTIEGPSATVIFMPEHGAPRTRTVELGGDPRQWQTVITLLVGNVVRDEAADVLGLIPEPAPVEAAPPDVVEPSAPVPIIAPAPLTAAPGEVAPMRPAGPNRYVGFGLLPGLTTDFTQVGKVSHAFSIDLLAGVSAGSSGVTISGVADIENGPVFGIQIAGAASFARRVSGTQVAGVAAASGELHGVQVAGAAAYAHRVNGAQIAGAAAVARSADIQVGGAVAFAHGRAATQIAGAVAAADGAANFQVGGAVAAARGDTNVQIAGAASVARSANVQIAGATTVAKQANIQIAGAVNVAGVVEGVQIAPFNIARRVDGVQVGVVNVGSADGFSLGLINIVPGGRADLEATIDTDATGTVLFRHGGRSWHNVYGIGGQSVDEKSGPSDDVWMYGFGFGPSWKVDRTRIDVELMGWQVNHGARHSQDISLLAQLRATAAVDFGPLKLVAGGAINTYISDDQQSPLILSRRTPGAMDQAKVTVDVWPSAFVGVRL
ncbi:MAG: hypothetical protein ACTHU0_32535 [Kofleriaceae bacterium]